MTASTEGRVELLARVPVLADLPREDLEQISAVAHPRRFAAGECVFREGDASNTCYIVHSGRARAVREHGDGRRLAGSSRESASRFLAVLERAGVISQGRGRLTVHDPEALRNYVY